MAGRELVSLLDFVHKRRLPGDGMEGLTSVCVCVGGVGVESDFSTGSQGPPLSARN